MKPGEAAPEQGTNSTEAHEQKGKSVTTLHCATHGGPAVLRVRAHPEPPVTSEAQRRAGWAGRAGRSFRGCGGRIFPCKLRVLKDRPPYASSGGPNVAIVSALSAVVRKIFFQYVLK